MSRNKEKNHSIFAETQKYLFHFFFVPFVILLCLFSFVSYKRVESSQKMANTTQFEQTVLNLGIVFDYSQKVLNTIPYELNIIDCLESPCLNALDCMSRELKCDTYLYNYNKDDEMSLYLIGNNGIVSSSNTMDIQSEDFTQTQWYTAILQGTQTQMSLYRGSHFTNDTRDVFALFGIPLVSFHNEKQIGICVSEINITRLLENEVSFTFPYFCAFENDDIFFIQNKDSKHYPQFFQAIQKIRYWADMYHQQVPILEHTGKFITVTMEESHSGVVFLAGSDVRQYQSLMILFFLVMPLVTVLGIVVARFFAKRISNRITEPIAILCSQIDKVSEGDLSVSFTFKNNPDLGRVAHHFNSMVVNIKELIHQVLQEQHEKRQYELMLLQAQINPHFLYNTLDSIIWLERMDCKDESIEMLNALTCFLRTGLNKGKDIISLENEKNNIESYLQIQSHRYRNVFSYEIDIPSSLYDLLVPKLILQPLVENAIYHGVKNCREMGFIHVYAYTKDGRDSIVVADTGIGMDEEKRKSLLFKGVDDVSQKQSTSYGLYNVQKRLKLYYNDKVSFAIQSAPGKGTQVSITLVHRPNAKTFHDTASIEKLQEFQSNE